MCEQSNSKKIFFVMFAISFATIPILFLNAGENTDYKSLSRLINAYILYPDEYLLRKLCSSIPEKIILSDIERQRLATQLMFSSIGQEIDASNHYAIRTVWKLIKADYIKGAYNPSDELLYMHLANLIRINPKLYLDILQEEFKGITNPDLEKIISYVPEPYPFAYINFLRLCSIKPLDLICCYELIKRKEALESITGNENIKKFILDCLEERGRQFQCTESPYISASKDQAKIISMIARLSRFISFSEPYDECLPELLPDNYEELKRNNYHFLLQRKLTDFLMREAVLNNREAARLFIESKVAYHQYDWLSVLERISLINPEYFFELVEESIKKGENIGYLPYEENYDTITIRQILKEDSIALGGLDRAVERIGILPVLVKCMKIKRSIEKVKEEKYQKLKIKMLSALNKTISDYKSKLLTRRPLIGSEGIKGSISEDGYLYEPPNILKEGLENFIKRQGNKDLNNLYNNLRELRQRQAIDDLGMFFILPRPYEMRNGLPGNKYLILESEALKGNEAAIKILFFLYEHSSSFMKEIIGGTLGLLMEEKPEKFLNVMSECSVDDSAKKEIANSVDIFRIYPYDADRNQILSLRKKRLEKIADRSKRSLVNKLIGFIETEINNQ